MAKQFFSHSDVTRSAQKAGNPDILHGSRFAKQYHPSQQFELVNLEVNSLYAGQSSGKYHEHPSKPMHLETQDDERYAQKFAQQHSSGDTAEPIIAHPDGSGKHEIIDGRHRARAAFLRGETHVKAYVPASMLKKSSEEPNDLMKAETDKKAAPDVQLNHEHGKQIADAYHEMKHDPNHPAVKEAYSALTHETSKQFKDLIGNGLKISTIKPGQENPYKSSKDLHADLKNNKHLWYFPTEQGFGSSEAGSDHPMLKPSEFHHDGKRLLANDLFRIVHDVNGHHVGGETGFGPKGEHQAFLTHKQAYSPMAQKSFSYGDNGAKLMGKLWSSWR